MQKEVTRQVSVAVATRRVPHRVQAAETRWAPANPRTPPLPQEVQVEHWVLQAHRAQLTGRPQAVAVVKNRWVPE